VHVSSRHDDPGGTGKPGDVIRRSGDGSPPAESMVRVRGQSPPKLGSGGGAPEAEQVLMIIMTFWLKFCS